MEEEEKKKKKATTIDSMARSIRREGEGRSVTSKLEIGKVAKK